MSAPVSAPVTAPLRFDLPPGLKAAEPPEHRGLARDGVRMMVAHRDACRVEHTVFARLPAFVGPGDLLVVNTSATLPGAVSATAREGGQELVVHFSTLLGAAPDGSERWVVELRRPDGVGTGARPWPLKAGQAGTAAGIPAAPVPALIDLRSPAGRAGPHLHLVGPFHGSGRLWVAAVHAGGPGRLAAWLARHGRPIRYDYVPHAWPLSDYQTVFACEPGSAEMPSAGRPFSAATVVELVSRGVDIAPVVLHTGVSSLEADELPYPERARVSASTARRVNATRRAGGRVIAVGTTVVRALESAFDPGSGLVEDFEGWTGLVVSPGTGVAVVDGLLTGWHEPEASHLLMLEAIAGRPLLEKAYEASLGHGYLWHEFGDVALFVP